MKLSDIRSAYEDMKVLIRMADDASSIRPGSEDEKDELKSKHAYIKSRLMKMAMGAHNKINAISREKFS